MSLTPNQILFFAVTNYLSEDSVLKLKNELIKYKVLSSKKFVEIISSYFDFNILNKNPIIPQDIWLYNYLVYDCNPKPTSDELDGRIIIKGRMKKTLLLRKYEAEVLIPQLKFIKEKTYFIGS